MAFEQVINEEGTFRMTTQSLSQYEEELLREIRQIPSSYLPNLIEIVKLLASQQKQKKEAVLFTSRSVDSSLLVDDMAEQELDTLLDIQASYESKERLREFQPMQVDFDRIEFESFPKSLKSEQEV